MFNPVSWRLQLEPAMTVGRGRSQRCAVTWLAGLLLTSLQLSAADHSNQTAAPAKPPAYNLMLASLSAQKITKWQQINQQPGYFNQPEFSRDGQTLYYTAEQQHSGGSQMDIASYQLGSGQRDFVARTALSEYSPTLLPAEEGLSVVVVEADGRQRLWRLATTAKPAVLLPDLIGVGYHAWGPQQDLLIFQLGDSAAAHQIVYRDKQGRLTVLAKNIGRGLAWQPEQHIGYFTERTEAQQDAAAERLALSWYNVATQQLSQRQLLLPMGAQDLRWASPQLLLTSAGNKIYSWQPGEPRWQLWLDLTPACQGTVSRFSLTPAQDRIAFVCQPQEQS